MSCLHNDNLGAALGLWLTIFGATANLVDVLLADSSLLLGWGTVVPFDYVLSAQWSSSVVEHHRLSMLSSKSLLLSRMLSGARDLLLGESAVRSLLLDIHGGLWGLTKDGPHVLLPVHQPCLFQRLTSTSLILDSIHDLDDSIALQVHVILEVPASLLGISPPFLLCQPLLDEPCLNQVARTILVGQLEDEHETEPLGHIAKVVLVPVAVGEIWSLNIVQAQFEGPHKGRIAFGVVQLG